MDDGLAVSRGVDTRQAARIAWDRALAFSWLGHRLRALEKFMAVLLWPFQLASVGGQGSRIRRVRGASLAANDGAKHQVHWPTVALAAGAIAVELTVLLAAGVVLALALSPPLPSTVAALVAILLVVSPLLVEVIGSVVALAGDGESLMLTRRRDELAEQGPAATMSSLVRSRRAPAGAGRRLLTLMKSEWQQQQLVVVFCPATVGLVAYYKGLGAVLDDGARRRMRFNCRRLSQSMGQP